MKKMFTAKVQLLFWSLLLIGWQAMAQTYTFTPAGATGINGPTQAQVNTAYANTTLASSVTVSGGIQEWTVPVGGRYKIEVYGAQGYGKFGNYDLGGRGAYLSGEFTFQPGDKIKILVGQEGGCCVSTSYTNQAGGGGGTFVVDENDSALIIAGGGGGAGIQYSGSYFMTTFNTVGDANVTTAGKTGTGATNGVGGTNGGGGGISGTAGGGAGYRGDGGTNGGLAFLNGGTGGDGTSAKGGFGGGGGTSSGNNIRTGGGGGYSGGGGVASSTSAALVGGGGGSYNTGMNQNDSVGVGYGDGRAIITLLAPAVMVPNNAGTMGFADLPSGICLGTLPIKVNVKNFGNNRIDSVMVTWEVNGTVQGSSWYQVNLDTLLSNNDEITVTVGNYNFNTYGSIYNIRAWTSLPNNVADTVNNNDTSVTTVGTQLSGTFTVNSLQPTGGSNFASFSALTTALNAYGVCGPVVVNVAPGTYNERLAFGNVPGSSATNTIRINGNGATLQYSSSSQSDMHLLTFDGAKYITLDSLTFKSLGTSYGWGALITNGSQYDSIIRCTFDLQSITGSSSANSNGITFTASPTSATTAGENGSDIYIGYSKVLGRTASGGPYYAFTMYGSSGQNHNSNNVIEHNIFSNFYYYGLYAYYGGEDNKFLYNDINRETKTSVTTFYGTYLYYMGPGTEIIGNKIHNPYRPGTSTTSTAYGLYIPYMQGTAANPCIVANNVVYGFNLNMTYGAYFYNSTYAKYYHNTIVNDQTNTSTGANYGIYAYQGTGMELKNNNVVITGGSAGLKYGIYYATSPTNGNNIANNNIYVNTTQPGGDNYAYNGSAFPTQAAWQAANPGVDAGSPSVDPNFINAATGDLTPQNPLVIVPAIAGVTEDINGATRGARTAAGAYDIFPNGNNNAGALALIGPDTAFCPGSKQVKAVIYNAGNNNITRLTVNWSVNGVNQTAVNYTQTLVPFTASSGKNMDTVILGNVSFPSTQNTNIVVWTSNPNNTTDPVASNDTAKDVFRAAMSGTYTVNGTAATGGTNFKTFKELTDALDLGGVCGPVIVNVTNTTYSENLEFNKIKGVSAVNTIRINGNGALLQYAGTTTNPRLLTLNGASYLTIDSLRFKSTSTYGWAAVISNGAEYDSIMRCDFDLTTVTNSSSTYSNGITFTSSLSSPTGAGENGSNCYIGYNTVRGAPSGSYYYAFTMYGNSGQNQNRNNVIEHNLFKDFYYYGIYGYYFGENNKFLYNEVTRNGKSSVTTFYGNYFYYPGPGTEFVGNKIHSPGGTLATPSTSSGYGIYCYYAQGTTSNPVLYANNVLYNLNQMITYGAYLYYNSNLNFYHNTIDFDIAVNSTSTQYGIYAYTSSTSYPNLNVKNNIISFTKGGTGTKYGTYYSSDVAIGDLQKNNIYMNSSQNGTEYYTYLAANYTTKATFNATYPQYEINSPTADPQFTNRSTGNLAPTNAAVIGAGENLTAIIPMDINEYPRSNPPTIGAFREAPAGTNNAGMMNFVSPAPAPCAGTQPVRVTVYNAGTNNITSVRVNWSVDGVTQTPTNWTGTMTPMGQGVFRADVTLGSVSLAIGTPKVIKVWTTLPNNSTDPNTANDTIEEAFGAAYSGTVTINQNATASGTNFTSFNDFQNALETYGVCGPLTVNVVSGSGPYTDTLYLRNIKGATPTNRVTIKGNGEVLQYNSNSTANMQMITFDGVSYVTIDNLTIRSMNATYGWGVRVANGSSNDSIINCTIDLSSITGSTSSYSSFVAFSGSRTIPTTAGDHASDFYVGHNTMLGSATSMYGPYYAVVVYGGNTNYNRNVTIAHNEISNFYYYGTYIYYSNNVKLLYNDINRKTKTSVSTFYGVYGTNTNYGLQLIGNRVNRPYGSSLTSTSTAYPIYVSASGSAAEPVIVANNAVYEFNQHIYYGLYITSSYIKVYNNTVSIDRETSTTSLNYGMYLSSNYAGTEFKNNIISLTAGGTGVKYGFYFPSGVNDQQKNNIYVNSSQGPADYGYNGSAYPTLAAYQAAFPGMELNSQSIDPQFVNPVGGDLTPGAGSLIASGDDVSQYVNSDINGNPRGPRPTPGAFEIPTRGINNAGLMDFPDPSGIYCPDSQDVVVRVYNGGVNNITSVRINWSVNGVLQTPVNYTRTLVPITASTGNFFDKVTLGKVVMSSNSVATIKAWTSIPNNGVDTVNGNDTIIHDFVAPTFDAVALLAEICPDGDAMLSLDPGMGYTPGDITWQYSLDRQNWTDIANSDMVNFTDNNVLSSRWYRVKLENRCYSSDTKVEVIGVTMGQVVEDSVCGPGIATLEANPADPTAVVSWYESATSTTVLDTGKVFTTPFLNTTTTYWASAVKSASPLGYWVGNATGYTSSSYMPFYATYTAQKGQYLYLASELLAAGCTPGEIALVGFDNNSVSNNYPYEDLSIKIGTTNLATLTNVFQTGLTAVYAKKVYNPINGLDTFKFNQTILWDGVSNVIVEVCHQNPNGNWGGSVATRYSNPGFTGSTYAYMDNNQTFCSNVTSTIYSTTSRPDIYFGIKEPCEGDRVPVKATILPPSPVVSLGADTIKCTHDTLTINAGFPSYTHAWNTNENTQIIKAGRNGTYTVAVTDINGCVGYDTIVVSQAPMPIVNVGPTNSICGADTLYLDGGNPGSVYQWSTGAISRILPVTQNGTYSVKVTNSLGCYVEKSTVVSSHPYPVVNLGPDMGHCMNEDLVLDAQNPGSFYLWNTGDSTQTYKVTQPGTYTVVVTTPFDCTDSATIDITANPIPTIGGLTSAKNPRGDVTFAAYGVQDATDYLWDFGDGNTSTLQAPTHDYARSAVYTVVLTLENPLCRDTFHLKVPFEKTGINNTDADNKQLTLYPNPAKDLVMLRNESGYQMDVVEVYNALGQLIYRGNAEDANVHQIDVRHYASGVYNVKVIMNDGSWLQRKFEICK